MNEYERRLAEIKRTPIPPGAALKPEQEEFLLSLTMPTLKWLNRQYWLRPDLDTDEAALDELKREVERLNEMDKAGLLADGWWCEWAPSEPRPNP